MSSFRSLTKKQRVAIYFISKMGKSLNDITAYYNITAHEASLIIQNYEAFQEKTCKEGKGADPSNKKVY